MKNLEREACFFEACFNMDPRLILKAIDIFYSLKNWDRLAEILDVAKRHGQFKAVRKIKQIGEVEKIFALQVPDFNEWFVSFGIWWFDLCEDKENNLSYIPEDDVALIKEIIEESFSAGEFEARFAVGVEKSNFPEIRKELLTLLFQGKTPVVNRVRAVRQNIDRNFREYCLENGIKIIRVLQEGEEGSSCCSVVYLALDSDGIFKVFKELLDYTYSPIGGNFNSEEEIYAHLPGVDFIPRFYGVINIGSARFIKLSFDFSRSLRDFINPSNPLGREEAIYIMTEMAKKLLWLHGHNVLHLDIKPENFRFDGMKIRLFDFGISRILKNGEKEVDVFLVEPRYGHPECGFRLKGSFASEVFQLGIIFYELLTGEHPFEKQGDDPISRFFLPNMVDKFVDNLEGRFCDPRLGIIGKMLNKNPENRPRLEEVIEFLGDAKTVKMPVKPVAQRARRVKEKNVILFPARMGIPHKEHIDYIARLLDMGFYVVISVQRSYTITQMDPIPKWFVMKMVAQSLFDKGFTEDDFNFLLTPFCETSEEMRMHFAMMPDVENAIAVASGNPGVRGLLPHLPVLDQKTVFGVEGESYETRSWGEILRKAVREGDYAIFLEYAASGVERILSFFEIREIYGKPEIEFVPGLVQVFLLDGEGQAIVSGKIFRYSTPEESIGMHLQRVGIPCKIIGRFERHAFIDFGGRRCELIYKKTGFENGNLSICYQVN